MVLAREFYGLFRRARAGSRRSFVTEDYVKIDLAVNRSCILFTCQKVGNFVHGNEIAQMRFACCCCSPVDAGVFFFSQNLL
jgi:hypothetical protein